MRITFIQNVFPNQNSKSAESFLFPHLGLISLISIVEDAGHHVTLIDPLLEMTRGKLSLDSSFFINTANLILRDEPDVVGFTTLGCNFIAVVQIVKHIKELAPDVAVILGGPQATVLHKEIMSNFDVFDLIVRNEAEETILSVIDGLVSRSLKNTPGVTFRCGSRVIVTEGLPIIKDLDSLPIPAYHHYPIRKLSLKTMRVEAGRGCPFQCDFCSTAEFFGRRYRVKSPLRLCVELDYLAEEYGITCFSLQHDLFTVNRKRVIAFCSEVRTRGFSWSCSARVDCVDEELLEIMAEAGCNGLYYGIESGSQRLQKAIKKNLDLSMVEPIFNKSRELGFEITASFVVGHPDEQPDDLNQTLDLMSTWLKWDSSEFHLQLHLLTPEPGTNLLNSQQHKLQYDGHVSDFNFPLLQYKDKAIIKQFPDIFLNYYYYPSKVPRSHLTYIASACSEMLSLSYPFLSHLLKIDDSKFSDVLWEIAAYADKQNAVSPLNLTTLLKFVEFKFGKTHYITSIWRYYESAIKLLSDANGSQPVATLAELNTDVYKLSRRAVILKDIHNCIDILQVIVRHEEENNSDRNVSPLLRNQRSDFLMYIPEAEKIVRMFKLNQWSLLLLELWSEPSSEDDVKMFFNDVGDTNGALAKFWERLLHIGILEASEELPRNRMRAASKYLIEARKIPIEHSPV